MKKIYLILAILLVTIPFVYSENLNYTKIKNAEADWLISCQLKSGAVLLNNVSEYDSVHVMPYYSNLALTGLLTATEKYNNNIKLYLEWYFNHINRQPDNLGVKGTIYDYYIYRNGTEIPEFKKNPRLKNYDSSDAYAGTFLSLFSKYCEKTNDYTYAKQKVQDLKLIASSINATFNPKINLTWAKKNYKVAYLMDNVEVWRGYQDLANLLRKINDSDANYYQLQADIIRVAIEKRLWKSKTQEYISAYGELNNWSIFYEDATANMWPILFDLPEAKSRSLMLYNKFSAYHRTNWINNQADESAWASIAVVALKVNKTDDFNLYLQNTNNNFLQTRLWPWYNVESGWLLKSLSMVEN